MDCISAIAEFCVRFRQTAPLYSTVVNAFSTQRIKLQQLLSRLLRHAGTQKAHHQPYCCVITASRVCSAICMVTKRRTTSPAKSGNSRAAQTISRRRRRQRNRRISVSFSWNSAKLCNFTVYLSLYILSIFLYFWAYFQLLFIHLFSSVL